MSKSLWVGCFAVAAFYWALAVGSLLIGEPHRDYFGLAVAFVALGRTFRNPGVTP